MAEHVRFRIGASLGSSFDAVLKTAESRAQRSARKIAREFNRAGKAMGGGGARGGEAAQISGARRIAKAHQRAAFDTEKYWEKAARKAAAEMERDHIKATRRMAAAQEREMGKAFRKQQRQAETFARRTSHRTTRFFWPNAPITSIARRVGGDILRGAGVDTNVSSLLGNVVSAEKVADALATQAYQKGAKGRAGKRQDPARLVKGARALAQRFGLDTGEVLEGQRRFVAQRGNLEAAEKLSPTLALLARSQGASFSDVMFSGAKIESALSSRKEYQGESNQAKLYRDIEGIIKVQVAQGKIGSVEMTEMAKQLPKLSGLAADFAGGMPEVFAQMQTVMQMAEKGMGMNATQAGTFALRFMTGLTSSAGRLDKAGVKVFEEEGPNKGLKRAPKDIILDLLWATSDPKKDKKTGRPIYQEEQLKGLLQNERALAGIKQFAAEYQGAGGGAAGIKAIEELFKRNSTALGDKQAREDMARKEKTTEFKAKRFNVKLEEVVANVAEKLLPALESLEEPALKWAQTLGNLATWTAENPKKAIGAALGAAILRAGIESTLRASIEKVILRSGGFGGGPGGGGYWGGRKGRGKGRRGTDAIGALTVGGMIGSAVGGAIYAAGTDDYDKFAKNYGAVSSALAEADEKGGLPGALMKAKEQLERIDKEYGYNANAPKVSVADIPTGVGGPGLMAPGALAAGSGLSPWAMLKEAFGMGSADDRDVAHRQVKKMEEKLSHGFGWVESADPLAGRSLVTSRGPGGPVESSMFMGQLAGVYQKAQDAQARKPSEDISDMRANMQNVYDQLNTGITVTVKNVDEFKKKGAEPTPDQGNET